MGPSGFECLLYWDFPLQKENEIELREFIWSSLIHTITIALRYARAIINYYPQGDVKSDDTEVTNGVKWTSLYLNTEGNKKFINSHLIYYSLS